MRTLICDLTLAECEQQGLDRRCDVLITRETLEAAHDCTGCFGCWIRTPGLCVVPDALSQLGPLFGATDELWIISKNTFGGYSHLVKRAIDRSIPSLSPNFRIVDKQMHHRMRYPHSNGFIQKIWLWGPSTAGERACFTQLAAANALNMGASLSGIYFVSDAQRAGIDEISSSPVEASVPTSTTLGVPHNVAFYNASPHGKKGTTYHLFTDFSEALNVYAGDCAPKITLTRNPSQSDTLILGYPLYVDAQPSGLIEHLETWAREHTLAPGTRIYALANMGFYEPEQILPSFEVLKNFCLATDTVWCGGLAVGGGGMTVATASAPRMSRIRRGCSEKIDRLITAVLAGQPLKSDLLAPCPIPRFAYKMAAEAGWRKSGVDLAAQPVWQPSK